MSIEIIRPAQNGVHVQYRLNFDYVGHKGWGFAFDCDESGLVDESKLNPDALQNYRACLSGSVENRPVNKPEIQRFESTWRTPKIGRCVCGEEVPLDRFTNTCDCGRDYNSAGQELAPRAQWGEETGESVADILAIDSMTSEELLDDDNNW